MTPTPQDVLNFWADAGPEKWWKKDAEFDAEITRQFEALHKDACQGLLDTWIETPDHALALVIILDQFSRNMFRGSDKSFANDPLAREIARNAIGRDQDLKIKGGEQQFFYLPFAHSEDLNDQDFGITCIRTRKHTNDDDALHARAHREIIREFGRFPFRNQVLGRQNTDAEQVFMDDGGYGTIVRKLQSS